MYLFDLTKSYDLVYNWFNILKNDKIETIAYVITPNHLHCILYFPEVGFNPDKILSNGKRFIAHKIINRLEFANEIKTLKTLQDVLTEREKKKKQLHKVFKDSFDAKAIFPEKFLVQKLNYIHHDPVSGKWNLAADFVSYEHSSASFYEQEIIKHFKPKDYNSL